MLTTESVSRIVSGSKGRDQQSYHEFSLRLVEIKGTNSGMEREGAVARERKANPGGPAPRALASL